MLTKKITNNQPTSNQQVTTYEKEKEFIEEINNKKENIKRKKFIKPTLEEVKEYCKTRNNKVNAERFIDYYESNGWKVGRNPMKDWKACVRTWEKNDCSFSNKQEEQVPNWFNENLDKQSITEEEIKELDELLEEFK